MVDGKEEAADATAEAYPVEAEVDLPMEIEASHTEKEPPPMELEAEAEAEAEAPPFEVVLPSEEGCAGGACSRSDKGGCCSSKAELERRYRPLYPELFGARFKREWLAESFAKPFDEVSAGARRAALRGMLRPEVEGRVFSFEMLTLEFCSMLLEELQHYEASGLPVQRPNSMNNYGVIVNQIGMRPLLDDLQARYIQPLAQLLFPTEGAQFSSHHSFMVQYRQGEDLGLDMHHDDSDVTLNVCLGKEFTGATLSFCGGFGRTGHRKHSHTYAHARGRGIIHLGSHRHGADDIATGERYSLIIWNQNGPWRESDEYKQQYGRNMHGADALEEEPDPICLSYTHDPDYAEHKVYPTGKGPKPGARQMHVKRYTPSEAAERAATLKARGTAAFKEQTYDAAASKYACAVDYAVEAGGVAEPALLSSLLLNEAQCRLNLREPESAAALCSKVLEREPENVKALYRRAVARIALTEFVEARRDLTSAAKLEPTNRDVRSKLAACKASADAQKARERELYAAMLGGGKDGDKGCAPMVTDASEAMSEEPVSMV